MRYTVQFAAALAIAATIGGCSSSGESSQTTAGAKPTAPAPQPRAMRAGSGLGGLSAGPSAATADQRIGSAGGH